MKKDKGRKGGWGGGADRTDKRTIRRGEREKRTEASSRDWSEWGKGYPFVVEKLVFCHGFVASTINFPLIFVSW
jgi:hypothetical protein